MSRMSSIDEHQELNRACDLAHTEERVQNDLRELVRDGALNAAVPGGQADSAHSPALPSSSQAAAGLSGSGDLGGRGRAPLGQEHLDFSPYTHSPSSQGTYSPHGGNRESNLPVRSLGSRSYHAGSQTQPLREGIDAESRQASGPRPTPASYFSALFPPPQAVTSVTTTHPTFPPYFNQNQPYHQSIAHPTQAASSRPSPLPSNCYHRYSQASSSIGDSGSISTHSTTPNSTGSPTPPSLSHSVSSASHSLVSSRPSSRAVSASGVGSPYHSLHSSHSLSSPFSGGSAALNGSFAPAVPVAPNFEPSFPSLSSSDLPSWPRSSGQSTSSLNQSKPHRSTSTDALGLPSYSFTHRHSSAPSTSTTPHLAHTSSHSASLSPYPHYTFEGEQEEELQLVEAGAEPGTKTIEYTGRRGAYASSHQAFADGLSYAPAQFTQPESSTASAFGPGTGSASYFERNLTGPGVASVTGTRGLLSPQQHFDRQKPGHTLGQRSENLLAHLLSGNTTLDASTHPTTMSGNMYHADVDMDPLESYDDDDILGSLPPGSSGYDAAGEYSTVGMSANASGSKKDEKQVRRRSSKACDQCRKSKCKCERTANGEPCKSCIMLGTSCTFLGPSRKRGPPKGYIDAIESRLHQTEALVGIILALANPERGVLDGDDPKPDERARSLLEDLRNNDPLAREIVERVDRGAYGTKGRKNNQSSVNVDTKSSSLRAGSGSGDERSSGSAGTVKEGDRASASGSAAGTSGPPASVQGRGRMVGLGQEMEMSGLSSAHPSNEWQDTVAERLKVAVRTRAPVSSGSTSSLTTARQPAQVPSTSGSGSGERERQRRRVDSLPSAQQQAQIEHSPERLVYPQLDHRQSMGSIGGASDTAGGLAAATSAARYSPPVAPIYASSMYAGSAVGQAPSAASSHSSYGMDSAADESENVEGEEGITGGVGQLSINEEAQVRFHGKASGLHLLGQKLRMDGRNKGGIWHFPKARVWPPVAPTSVMHIARAEEAEACERAARARLPARDVQEHLLELYFAHVHPFLPIVHKQTFLQDFRKMHDEQERDGRSASKADSPDDRGRPTEPSPDGSSRGDQSTSTGSTLTKIAGAAEGANSDRSASRSPPPRIPTLLLLAMFSIAARYAPVAHGTTASPQQVLLEPSRSTADTALNKGSGNPTNSESATESDPLSPSAGSPAASRKADVDAAAELESDAALPHPQSGHMWAAGDGFLERAKVLLDRSYASSRPSTCQALILMGYREIGIGAMAQSWLYVGMAVRMAQDLGMHRSSDGWSCEDEPIFSPIEQQIRKRIWYACVVMDKYVSAYIGRPLSIFEADYDTRLPGVEESEELELWAPHDSLPNSLLSDPVDAITAPVPPFTPVPGRVLSCFNESARLSSILAMIIQAIYAVNPVSSRHLEALQLERTLDKWYMDLPEYLRFDTSFKSVSSPPPNVLTLHMQYWCAVILLHRPFVPHYITMRRKRLNAESPVDQNAYSAAQKNFSLCVSAANHITSILSIYQEHFCLKRCSVFLSYYIFTAGIMHMTTMATNSNDPQASLGLSKCMTVLKRIEIVWPSAGRAWELLHGAKDDLPDYELPLAGTDRPRKRSADEPLDTVLLGDPSYLHAARSASTPSTQIYAPSAVNGQRYDPALDIAENSHPLALFNSFSRWSSDGSLGFPSGLSTSVLPQQYSTGFVDERTSPSVHRSPAAVADGNGRFAQYWSDYSMGQPSSMLGSMYDLSILSHANHHDQSGQHAPQSSHHPQSFQGAPSLYMNDQYSLFNPLPPP